MPISALEARALHDSIRFTHLDRGHCWALGTPSEDDSRRGQGGSREQRWTIRTHNCPPARGAERNRDAPPEQVHHDEHGCNSSQAVNGLAPVAKRKVSRASTRLRDLLHHHVSEPPAPAAGLEAITLP
ncbi:hypothetical protein SNOG_09166 [Parastagonospora nodorum SN15]|uniref:Uncharacterized protein n=1 Tax=Phaeosphaeria nodorum (strain SN15 / ATCC MYA-4574 / FGSC 10173) TaxID=321614 RepID=Q0UGE8_PHANO|nr:hypothetical protein SNOG_09166 [Parastagonospora nodorum SN15]EAT83358.1 hypothetical protein SNOG_09166 [Parastagonospora nodorum SN15]